MRFASGADERARTVDAELMVGLKRLLAKCACQTGHVQIPNACTHAVLTSGDRFLTAQAGGTLTKQSTAEYPPKPNNIIYNPKGLT